MKKDNRRLIAGKNDKVSADQISTSEWWYGTCLLPGHVAADGLVEPLPSSAYVWIREHTGYRVAVTEWNWNGWSYGAATEEYRRQQLPMAQALGTAGFTD